MKNYVLSFHSERRISRSTTVKDPLNTPEQLKNLPNGTRTLPEWRTKRGKTPSSPNEGELWDNGMK